MRSQVAYVEHILECIRRISEDSAGGREVVFDSHTHQDAHASGFERGGHGDADRFYGYGGVKARGRENPELWGARGQGIG